MTSEEGEERWRQDGVRGGYKSSTKGRQAGRADSDTQTDRQAAGSSQPLLCLWGSSAPNPDTQHDPFANIVQYSFFFKHTHTHKQNEKLTKKTKKKTKRNEKSNNNKKKIKRERERKEWFFFHSYSLKHFFFFFGEVESCLWNSGLNNVNYEW